MIAHDENILKDHDNLYQASDEDFKQWLRQFQRNNNQLSLTIAGTVPQN